MFRFIMPVFGAMIPVAGMGQLIGGSPALGQAITGASIASQPPASPKADWQSVDSNDLRTLYQTEFPSAFKSDFPENNIVPMWLSVPNQVKNPPVVLLLHYLGAADLRAEEVLSRKLNQQGIAAAYIALPFHLARTPEGYKSGQLAITPNIHALNQFALQSTWDVERAMQILSTRPDISSTDLGIAGVSLGSLIAETCYGVDPKFKVGAFILGGTNVAHIFWNSAAVVPTRNDFKRKGFTENSLRHSLWAVDPGTWIKAREASGQRGQALVVRAQFDQIMPPSATNQLIDLLPGASVITLDTGHYGGFFVQDRIDQQVAEYFADRFAGKTYQAPAKLNAPTLRLTAQALSNIGFDIGVGLDVFRTNQANPYFGLLFATPRGVGFFAGKDIGAGLAIGAAIATRGFGVGIMWSAIL